MIKITQSAYPTATPQSEHQKESWGKMELTFEVGDVLSCDMFSKNELTDDFKAKAVAISLHKSLFLIFCVGVDGVVERKYLKNTNTFYTTIGEDGEILVWRSDAPKTEKWKMVGNLVRERVIEKVSKFLGAEIDIGVCADLILETINQLPH